LAEGKGGKFLFLPPDYQGDAASGYFVFKSRTYGNWLVSRAFLINDDLKPTVEHVKQHFRMYPLAQAADPPEEKFLNFSCKAFNTIHANDVTFWSALDLTLNQRVWSASFWRFTKTSLMPRLRRLWAERGGSLTLSQLWSNRKESESA